MNKASYEEYLPPDFDSKTELEATLKSYANSRAKNKTPTENIQKQQQQHRDTVMTSRQTLISFYDENNEIFRSETDLNTSQLMTKEKPARNNSRLSGQPVLSSQQLIDNLNNNELLKSNQQQQLQQQNGDNQLVSDSLVNYTKEYNLDEPIENHPPEEVVKSPQDEIAEKKLTVDEAISQKLQKPNKDLRRLSSGKRVSKETDMAERRRLLYKRGESQENRLLSAALVVKIPAFQQQNSELEEASQQQMKTHSKKVAIKKRNERLCRVSSANKTELVNRNVPVKVDVKNYNKVNLLDDGGGSMITLNNEQQQESLVQLSGKRGSRSMNFNNTPSESRLSIIDKETFYSAGLENFLFLSKFKFIFLQLQYMSKLRCPFSKTEHNHNKKIVKEQNKKNRNT